MCAEAIVMAEIEQITQVIELLSEIANDRTVPRNIRAGIDECIEVLKSTAELSVKINSVVSILDELANDTNIPRYTRTEVWNVASMLEGLKE